MVLNFIKENIWLILIIVLGTFLRFYHLDYQSIWLDEIHTMIEGNPSLPYSEFYDIMLLREQMPHLYYILVRVNSFVFGHSTFVVRSLSAIFGIASIYSIYLLTKELSNKKAGYFAALLLSINYFHIWYSQEARPYVLLALFTILSFYRLVKFIKNFSYRNAILYAIFTALMINTHFFGLFVLVSQFILILYFIFEGKKSEIKTRFIKSALAGLVTLLLWLPSIPVFLIVTKIKSFWIQPPVAEVYTGLFKEFFGYSESVIFILSLLSVFFFIKVFSSKYTKSDSKENNLVFSFIILSVWVFITLLIPFIRTYLDVPMIISRYFISVLPAAIIIVSLGFNKIKNNIVQSLLVFILLTSSLVQLFLVKENYTKVSKTQYRELTSKVIDKNKFYNAKIHSVWGWHLRHFFTNDKVKMTTQEQTLNELLNSMRENKQEIDKFWFIGAHFQNFEVTSENEEFLNKNFNLVEKIEYYDIWARYYVPKGDGQDNIELNINEFEPIKSDNNVNILLFSNSTTRSKPVVLQKGNYYLVVKAKSLPNPPINGENAHLTANVNGEKIGASFITEKEEEIKYYPFEIKDASEVNVELTFGNDLVLNDLDRNLLIYSVRIEKIKK